MRRFFSLLVLFFVFTIVRSQNLEFSQVHLFSGTLMSQYDTPTPANSLGPLHTVPDGKVWKIESVFSGAINHLGFYINGIFCRVSGGSNSSQMIFPIWLNEGDTVQAYIMPYALGIGEYYISIIEFTSPQ
jgi:hypothetical protein